MAFATFDNSQVNSLMPHKSMTEVWALSVTVDCGYFRKLIGYCVCVSCIRLIAYIMEYNRKL